MRRYLDDAFGGLLCSLLSLTFAFSYGALIFSGPLRPWLAEGIAASLVTASVAAAVMALTSRLKGVIAGPESSTVAVIAAMTIGMGPALATAGEGAFGVAIAAVSGATLVSGALLVAMARLRLGRYVRFVPYPVLAGFMASVGWSVTVGALQLGADATPHWRLLLEANRAELLVTGLTVATGALILLATARLKHPLTLPIVLLAVVGLTHGVLALLNIDAATARRIGVLFDLGGTKLPAWPLFDGSLRTLDWGLFAHALWYIPAIALMTVISVLLNTTGLETATRSEVDLDHELQASGFSNLVSGGLGGYVGYVSVSRTTLNRSLGARGAFSGLLVAAVCAVAIFVGSEISSVIPRFVLGGLLFSIGGRLLWEWIVARRRTMPIRDRAIVLGIVAVSAMSSMLYGMVAGLIAGCLIFAVDVGRVRNVRRRSGLDERPSCLLRSAEEMSVLAANGRRVQVLELENHLFFGSAHRLYEDVSAYLAPGELQEIIIDFAHVRGIDSSAAAVFSKIAARAQRAGCALTFSGCEARDRRLLVDAGGSVAAFHDKLDSALEAAEDKVIVAAMGSARREASLRDWMTSALGDSSAASLIDCLAPSRLEVGSYLCRQGDPTETLIFIESGRVSVLVAAGDEAPHKVRSFDAHTIVGEISFFTGAARTATLRVEQEAVVWTLDRAAFSALQERHPASAAALYDYVIRILSERLAFATRQATAALR